MLIASNGIRIARFRGKRYNGVSEMIAGGFPFSTTSNLDL